MCLQMHGFLLTAMQFYLKTNAKPWLDANFLEGGGGGGDYLTNNLVYRHLALICPVIFAIGVLEKVDPSMCTLCVCHFSIAEYVTLLT